jgi:predicted nucleic acid-binding protein
VKADRKLVLDANILVRAVLGTRVQLLHDYEDSVSFFTPELCFEEARRSLVAVSAARELDMGTLLAALDQVAATVEAIDAGLYEAHAESARARIAARDFSDWQILAAALLLNCPIWTEDRDFFGSGVAIWTTNNVEVYLRGA